MIGWSIDEFHANRRDIERSYLRSLQLVPEFFDRIRAAKRETRFVGTADQPFFRKPYGRGWALVGDAGYHKDPIAAWGSATLRDAELLAEALDEGFAGRRPADEALAGYQQARDRRSMPMYELTCDLAKLEPFAPENGERIIAGAQPIPA